MEETTKHNLINNIKSIFVTKKIIYKLYTKKLLKIIKYNKNIQKKFDIGINDYKKFEKIEIELIPICKENKNIFINNNENREFYHIYFNDGKNEIKRNYFRKNYNIKKINIKIDKNIKSFYKLFYKCNCIEKIKFIKFNRNDIENMSYMFYKCKSLKELNLSNFNTNNVTNMSDMFSGCSSLTELNLSNFNTNNVKDINCMFSGCSSLTELNLSNFNTNNVTLMNYMFYGCSLLKEINCNCESVKNKFKNKNLFEQYLIN